MRYAVVIEYDGSGYCGWQIQPNGITIQEVMQKAFFDCFGMEVSLVASGRTDKGVHSKGQVAHFDTTLTITNGQILAGWNSFLPKNIVIKSCREVGENFHARFSAKKKTYSYTILNQPLPSPLLARFACHIKYPLDIGKMQEASAKMIGRHDFRAFMATGSEVVDTIRTIYELTCQRNGDCIEITVTGDGFLYNMVRILAGTLVEIGTGKRNPDCIDAAFLSLERTLLGKTLAPEGLCLVKVDYQDDLVDDWH